MHFNAHFWLTTWLRQGSFDCLRIKALKVFLPGGVWFNVLKRLLQVGQSRFIDKDHQAIYHDQSSDVYHHFGLVERTHFQVLTEALQLWYMRRVAEIEMGLGNRHFYTSAKQKRTLKLFSVGWNYPLDSSVGTYDKRSIGVCPMHQAKKVFLKCMTTEAV